jgi:tetratricopeptide (TPR) repeat protein
MIDCVHRFEGTVTQILGDGIMAVFGVPVAQEDHAFRACLAAQAIQTTISRSFDARSLPPGPPMAVRVGLSSGEVLMQTVENDLSSEYRLAGEAVYLAARMERIAGPGGVLLGEDTLRLAVNWVKATPVKRVSLATVSRSVMIFELAEITREKPMLRDRVPLPRAAFVGREDDLRLIHDALEDAESGTGKTLVLKGEAGVGKTRLVHEFLDSTPSDTYRVVEFALHATPLAKPLDPLRHIVENLLTIEPRDATDGVGARVSGFLGSLGISGDDGLSAVLEILQVPHESPSWSGMDPPERLGVMIETVTRMILEASRLKPIIIVIEDFHWADSETRLFVDELVPRLMSSRVFLVVTSRTQQGKAEAGWPEASEHEVRPLTAPQSAELLQVLLGGDPELDDLKDLLVKTTQGVPFFIEECVRTLADSGALSGTEGAYRPTGPINNVQIPATVHGVLAARIDSLSPDDRLLLLCASVVGQSFDAGLLRDITGTVGEVLIAWLNRMQAEGFIQRTRILPNLEFSFRHVLIRDVAYATLTKRRRRELHAKLTVAIRKRRPEQLSGRCELLAHHAFCAQIWPKAVIYCRNAGQSAQARSRNREAADFFEMALQALEELPSSGKNIERSIDIRLELAKALFPLGKYDKLNQQLLVARERATDLGDKHRIAAVAALMTVYHWKCGGIPAAMRVAKTALDLAEGLKDFELEISSAIRLGAILVDRGNYERACDLLRATIARIPADTAHRRFGLLIVASVAYLTSIARALGELGQFEEAIRAGDEAIRIADEVGHVFSQFYACTYFGGVLLRRRDFERSIPILDRAYTLYEEKRIKLLSPLSAASLGYAIAQTGGLSRGIALLENAISSARRLADKNELSMQLNWLAQSYFSAGQTNKAISCASRALELAERYGEGGHEGWALWALGDIRAGATEPLDPVALRHVRQAQAIAVARHMAPLAAHCHVSLGKIYRRQRSLELAHREFAAAISRYRELDMGRWLELAESEAERIQNAPLLELR